MFKLFIHLFDIFWQFLINNYMNNILDEQIKEINEELELLSLSPKNDLLVTTILENPLKTFKECCAICNYKGTHSIIKTSKCRKALELRRKLNNLYTQRQSSITKEEVLMILKGIISESSKDRIPAIALATKILGFEAPIKTDNKNENITILKFVEDV